MILPGDPLLQLACRQQKYQKQCRNHHRSDHAQALRMFYDLHHHVFAHGVQVVHRPVQHESRRAVIQKYQKNQRQHHRLDLLFQRRIPCIDHAADQVDTGHQYRQHIDCKPPELQHPVFRPKIRDQPETRSLQAF